jgi:ATP-dependent Clp protease ATP-binding subunit ClpA
MLERFTKDARMVVVDARRQAVELNAPQIDPLHLLVALVHTPPGAGVELLTELGFGADELTAELHRVTRRGGISDSDVEALSEFGIDVERIVEQVELTHGKGALAGGSRLGKSGRIQFSREAKKTLELSLREAVDNGDKYIGEEHLLLGLTRQGGPAAELLATRDIDNSALRRVLNHRKAS